MDIEFHYYITYLIAAWCGFSPDQAYKIAYAAQYVDDNYMPVRVNWRNSSGQMQQYRSVLTQSYIPDLKNGTALDIYPIYHFIPIEGIQHSLRKDGKTHPLETRPGALGAENVLKAALKSHNLFRIGIATHSFVDTWSHQNFTGTYDKYNAASSPIAQIIPNIGHADVFNSPDRVGLIWEDNRLVCPIIDNNKRFLDASWHLMKEYMCCNFGKVHTGKLQGNIKKLSAILGQSRRNFALEELLSSSPRLKKYQDLFYEEFKTTMLHYDENHWKTDAVRYDLLSASYSWRNLEDYQSSNWYLFQEAAAKQRALVKSYAAGVLEGVKR